MSATGVHRPEPSAEDFGRALRDGLRGEPRGVAPKYFYDRQGSALFDRICELPEYYPTRTEFAILRQHAAAFGGDPTTITIAGQSAGAGLVSVHAVSSRYDLIAI